jgi:hypothetical protein
MNNFGEGRVKVSMDVDVDNALTKPREELDRRRREVSVNPNSFILRVSQGCPLMASEVGLPNSLSFLVHFINNKTATKITVLLYTSTTYTSHPNKYRSASW